MASKVILPKFGQTVEVSEITQWLKHEGDAVRRGDVLCEIATDKSSLEVESPYDGTLLKIVLPIKTSAPVGCVIALLGAPGEVIDQTLLAECLASGTVATGTAGASTAADVPPAATPTQPSAPSQQAPIARDRVTPVVVAAPPRPNPAAAAVASATAPPQLGERLFVSPRARRLAREKGVPLLVLSGSGENGRIVEDDVAAYLAEVGPISPAVRAAALTRGLDLRAVRRHGGSERLMLDDLGALTAVPPALPERPALVARIEAATPMRRAIAQAMSLSARDIPAFALEATIDASPLIARRSSDKAAGVAIGYGDYIAKAVALAIRSMPVFAAQWRDGTIAYLDRVHIAFAVSLAHGLVTPVVRDCDRRSLAEMAADSARLVERARSGKLGAEDYSGGVFTLSNLGGMPIDRFTAIVPPGQSGILAIGRIRDEVVIKDGGFFAGKRMSLTLSADHRYIDGAEGAKFLTEIKTLLEDPRQLG